MAKVTVLTSSYKSEKYLRSYFKSITQQTFKNFEVSFQAVLPSDKEKNKLNKFKKKHLYFKSFEHTSLISLPKAWNLGIKESQSELICIWNVNDLRTKGSLNEMVKAFESDSDIGFVYGNYTIVKKFKKRKGNFINESNRENELKSSMILGPFFMFRKTVVDTIGMFDEQLKSGSDYDFAMRMARKFRGLHIDYNLGYYLNDKTGISTKEGSLQEIERTVVELRYNLEVLNPKKVKEAKDKYNISKLMINDKFVEI